ncbi:MAG TPA: PIN domain-containing protein [Candidatus Saccharimonadales bacterium]|nr:PIN domain-containing protein [Candidatus Saccharimonadales bacterium]
MPAKVLDSFALVAYFRDEPGAGEVEDLLIAAGKKDIPLHMTDVNYAEVKYCIVKRDGAKAWAEAAKILEGLPIDFHSTTRALADAAADFKARHKMSLADAFAAALAREKGAELITGDPEFKALEREIKIIWWRK